MKNKTTIRISKSAQANLALIIDSVGCNQTAAIENALAVYASLLQGCKPTPLALDGAIAPDNQQVLPADVLDGDGILPEPPRQ